jgi:menaquinone-specific isochorismate synthase
LKTLIDKINEFVNSNSPDKHSLTSLIFEFDIIDFISVLNNIQIRDERYFYTAQIADGIRFLGFDSVFEVNEFGKQRLENTEQIISELQNNFISNWDDFNLNSIPLFVGGMKFSTNISDNLWNDYADSEWFVPKFLFFEQNEQQYLVYNFRGENCNYNNDLNILESILKSNISESKSIGKIAISSNGKEKAKWVENVNKALKEIDSGEVQKIVLSRQVDLELENSISISNVISTLGERYPKCYVFAFRKNESVFFGASPEKLAKISNGWIEADALAGSISRGKTSAEDDSLADTLLSSKKDLAEQEIVVSFIKDSFARFCNNIVYEEKPIIRKLPNIQHLWTPIKGKINQNESVFSVLKELHPTPAICGVPWTKARDSIIEMEPHNRGLFSGMIGWFNLKTEGEFAVAIRSALIKKKSIHAFAGCGIVKGSDSEIEYAESELKLKPIISLFESIK